MESSSGESEESISIWATATAGDELDDAELEEELLEGDASDALGAEEGGTSEEEAALDDDVREESVSEKFIASEAELEELWDTEPWVTIRTSLSISLSPWPECDAFEPSGIDPRESAWDNEVELLTASAKDVKPTSAGPERRRRVLNEPQWHYKISTTQNWTDHI